MSLPAASSLGASAGPRAWAALLVVAMAAAYAGTLQVPFVYDDILAIPENPSIRQLWPLSRVLTPAGQGGLTVSGRPVLNLSFALSYALSGQSPWGHHVFNLLVHAGSALLLASIVRRTLARAPSLPSPLTRAAGPVGTAVALGWSLHPLLTQAVTYTVQRAESLMGLFFFLTLYGFVRSVAAETNTTRRRWAATAVAACLLGMGTKEVMAVAPLLVFLYDRTFVAGTWRGAWRERWPLHLAFAGTWIVLAALLVSTGGNRGGTVGFNVGVPLWAYPLTQFEALTRYLGLSLWPQPLVFEYGTFWVARLESLLPYLGVVLPLCGLTLVALLRWPAAGFCGAWFFLILAPTSLAPGTIQMIVEHRMYLPLAAVVTLALAAGQLFLGRRVLVAAGAAAVAFLVLTFQRNADYRSHLTLWQDTVAKRPLNPRAHQGLAEAYEERNELEAAVRHRREAVRLLPDEGQYHYNLALVLARVGNLREAILHYQLTLRLTPNEARAHNNLALLLGKTGDTGGMLEHYARAVHAQPADPLYHYNFGIALVQAGNTSAAVAQFNEVLRLSPDHPDAHYNVGAAHVRRHELPEALAHYEAAVRTVPTESLYRVGLGNALLLADRPADAMSQFRAALKAQPDNVDALFGTANALGALKQPHEAIATYEAVLKAAPEHSSAHFKLGNALLDGGRDAEAAQHFQAAVRVDPRDAEAHHNLGVAYAKLERWAEARREFETALQLKPDYADARRNLQQLRAVFGF